TARRLARRREPRPLLHRRRDLVDRRAPADRKDRRPARPVRRDRAGHDRDRGRLVHRVERGQRRSVHPRWRGGGHWLCDCPGRARTAVWTVYPADASGWRACGLAGTTLRQAASAYAPARAETQLRRYRSMSTPTSQQSRLVLRSGGAVCTRAGVHRAALSALGLLLAVFAMSPDVAQSHE